MITRFIDFTKEELEKIQLNRVPTMYLHNHDNRFDEETMKKMLETAKERGPLIKLDKGEQEINDEQG